MSDKFFTQVPKRLFIYPDRAQEDFSLYVRLSREKLGMDRATLAKKAGLEREVVAFLENHLLFTPELTEEVCEKIEQALGTPYQAFMIANRDVIEELQSDWKWRCCKEPGGGL